MYRGHIGDTVNALAWSPTEQLLASAGHDGRVHVWDTTGGQPVTIYRGHTGAVLALAWSPDGKEIVSGGFDAMMHVWESLTGKNIALYRGQPTRVLSVAWDPLMQRGRAAAGSSSAGLDVPPVVQSRSPVACGREDGMVHVWDSATGREVVEYRHSAAVYTMAWSPNGRRFAFATEDMMVHVWDTLSNLKLFTFQHMAPVHVMAWSPDGKYIASSGSTAIDVWVAP